MPGGFLLAWTLLFLALSLPLDQIHKGAEPGHNGGLGKGLRNGKTENRDAIVFAHGPQDILGHGFQYTPKG